MTKNMVKPKNILSTLKYRRKDNLTFAKQVYNAHQKYKKMFKNRDATIVDMFGRQQLYFQV